MSQPPHEPAQLPAGARSSASRAVLVYTGGRVVAFLVSLGVLRLLGFRTFALFLGALVLSALLSLAFLRRQRAALSEALVARPKRDALTRRPARRPGAGADEAGDVDAYDPYADDEDDLPGDGADPDPDVQPPVTRTPGGSPQP